MTLANVALTDTFDIWRTRTNQLIGVYSETNLLSRAAYNATNSFVSTTANITANLITSNAIIMNTIYNNANTVVASNAGNILFSNAAFVTAVYNNANTVVPQQVLANTVVMNNIYRNANTIISANAGNILFSNAAFVTTVYNNANTVVPQQVLANTIVMNNIYNNANSIISANAGNILFSNAAFVTAVYNNANTVIPQQVLSNTTVMNNFYNNANTVISSNAANIIYSNTIIITNFYNNANTLVNSYLANNNVTSVLVIANTANATAIAAFDKANSFNNVYTTIAGSNTAVGTGANSFATAATAGANAFMISVQNGSNTAVGTGANAFATAAAAGANAFATAAAAGANAFMISVQNGSNTAVGTGANTVGSAAFIQANSALVTANLDTVSATRYLVFDDATTGAFNRANVSFGLTYNPSTNTLNTKNIIVTDNVGIGRSDPTYEVDVVGTINASNILINGSIITASGGGGGGANLIIDLESSTRYVTFANNTTGVFSQANVSTSLTFDPSTGTLSATIFNSTSDVRQKKNIESVDNALSVIRSIEGVKFDWVNTGERSYGVIAQEIERVLPELVKESDGIKSVNYSGIIAFLIQAVKELDEKIEKK